MSVAPAAEADTAQMSVTPAAEAGTARMSVAPAEEAGTARRIHQADMQAKISRTG